LRVLSKIGLPFPVLTGEKAKAVVNKVEQYLLTPMGLRTLAPSVE
jgi:glycogen debranching enzyme